MKKSAKIISIVICLSLLIIPLVIPVSAETVAPEGEGLLAISEICPSPANGAYEFIELVNVGDGKVSLSDYYLIRFAFSHSGRYAQAGIRQIYGYHSSQSLAKLAMLPLSGTDVELNKFEIAVIWFVSVADKAKTVNDFKAYWTEEGNDMTNVVVVRIEVFGTVGGTEVNLYPATGINGNSGTSFLPDSYAGFIIDVTKASSLEEKITIDGVEKKLLDWTVPLKNTGTTAFHAAADSTAVCFTANAADTVNSRNYYGFIDPGEFAAQAALDIDGVIIGTTTPLIPLLISGTVGAKPTADGSISTKYYYTSSTAWNDSTATDADIFVSDGTKDAPSPGKLLEGQFGFTGALELLAAQVRNNGDSLSVRFIGYVDSLDYSEIGYYIYASYVDAEDTVRYNELLKVELYTVYNSVMGGGNVYDLSYFSKEDGYFAAFAVSGLPLEADNPQIEFFVLPYGITTGGETVYSSYTQVSLQNILK